MTHWLLSFFLFTTLILGQTFQVKDRNGTPVVTVSRVQMFRYSDYFKDYIPDFQGTVKNVSGERLLQVSIGGIVHKKDGSVVNFTLENGCGTRACDFETEFT